MGYKSMEMGKLFHIRLEIYYRIFIFKHKKKVSSKISFRNFGSYGFFHFFRYGYLFKLILGEIHFKDIVILNYCYFSVKGIKLYYFLIFLVKIKDNIGGCQKSVSAHIYFTLGCKPSEAVRIAFFQNKCSLNQPVFNGYFLHKLI